jgi:hypothetical protein
MSYGMPPNRMTSMDLRVGGKYRIGKKIGSGSFGELWAASTGHGTDDIGDIYLGVNIVSGEARVRVQSLQVARRRCWCTFCQMVWDGV